MGWPPSAQTPNTFSNDAAPPAPQISEPTTPAPNLDLANMSTGGLLFNFSTNGAAFDPGELARRVALLPPPPPPAPEVVEEKEAEPLDDPYIAVLGLLRKEKKKKKKKKADSDDD